MQTVAASQRVVPLLTMAEKITVNPGTESAAETSPRRLPFTPIFDTIVTEPLRETPTAAEEAAPATPAAPSYSEEKSAGAVLFRPQIIEPPPLAASDRALTWTIAGGMLAIVLALVWMGFELHSQQQMLKSELNSSSSRVASAVFDSSTLEQRPWLGIAEVAPQPPATSLGTFSVTLQNTGRTPALQARIAATAQLTDVPAEADGAQAIAPVNQGVGTILPGAQSKFVLDFPVSHPALVVLYHNQGHLVLHIAVTYEDIFQASHTSQSCWSWQPGLRQMESCGGYGTVN